MDNRYSCEVIQDLIPGYIDGVLSETGTKVVQEHLEDCRNCRQVYDEMTAGSEKEGLPKEEIALDGFRKIRRRTRILKIIVGLFSGLLLVGIFSGFLLFFVIGLPAPTSGVSILNVSYQEEDQSLTIEGELNYFGYRVSRVVWEESDSTAKTLFLTVYIAETLPFYQGRKDFSVTIPNMEDYVVYLDSPKSIQEEVYRWTWDHSMLLYSLEEEIYSCVSELDRERDVLLYEEMVELDGKKMASFSVEHLFGEDVWYGYYGGRLVMHGDNQSEDYKIWISIEEPYSIFVYNRVTGEYTQDTSVILQYRKGLEEKGGLP